ncbi:hypothetical protein BOTBODRAFT_31397 [Botryobasidium botryosum FD-172 SS1]|uniref:Lariat debranching enzyme C-terminal domain-containing protein n=1 Tax=Botryobasidium botryosum (strain FD-172 SS1) TaxID=930990 RepID=A0A067MVQ0_BOTB1|nr:hypothetical protein BOTBODRAFT_31397 [Botryobasidium botryosum FD-172 SS1]
MKIAVEGCCHGSLDAIYSQIARLENENNYTVDVLLICGDFQAIRNNADLACMAVPDKYKQLGGFHKYYTGEKVAPILTIVIGGNHEASNYMWELYHGGWLAPNMYYLGGANCVRVNGIRIAGTSGIYKFHDYHLGHFERLPYDRSSVRSIYHIRHYDVFKLLQLTSPNVFLSHDWPQSIEHHGNLPGLLRRKPFFREDIERGRLGSPPLLELLRTIRPKWWFAAHLHVKFEARFQHGGTVEPEAGNPDEIAIDSDDDETETQAVETATKAARENPDEIALDEEEVEVHRPAEVQVTQFLALDKCLPRRDYLEVIDILAPVSVVPPEPSSAESAPQRAVPSLTYDPEWLAITRALHSCFSTTRNQTPLPAPEDVRAMVERELMWVKENIGEDKSIDDVQQFSMTAPGPSGEKRGQAPIRYSNPQTEAFCNMLGITNKIA